MHITANALIQSYILTIVNPERCLTICAEDKRTDLLILTYDPFLVFERASFHLVTQSIQIVQPECVRPCNLLFRAFQLGIPALFGKLQSFRIFCIVLFCNAFSSAVNTLVIVFCRPFLPIRCFCCIAFDCTDYEGHPAYFAYASRKRFCHLNPLRVEQALLNMIIA